MNEKAANLYIPDFRAWESFYEKRAKRDQRVGIGFESESEPLNRQQQELLVVNSGRVNVCDQKLTEPKIVSVVSPTEQTVQQAANVMKKEGIKVKTKKCSGKKGYTGKRSKKAKSQKKSRGKKSTFSYRTLSDIFSKRR